MTDSTPSDAAQVWINAATAALTELGPAGVTVEGLARRLEVTKGGFYWHFANRGALDNAVLQQWETAASTGLDRAGVARTSEATAAALVELAATTSRLETAIRAWALTAETPRATVRRVDELRTDRLAELLQANGLDEGIAKRRARYATHMLTGAICQVATDGPSFAADEIDELLRLFGG